MHIRNWLISGIKMLLNVYIDMSDVYNINMDCIMPMPHGSDKSPAKNRHEICHSLCMPHGSAKSWQIIKKMTYKNLNIVKKTSSSV